MLDAEIRLELRQLWHAAYGDRFSDEDARHAFGGVHVLAIENDVVVGHASGIPRSIQFGDGDWQAIAYVEAVAVHPDFQRQGIGTAVMQVLQTEMSQTWPIAMLSTGRATSFYETLGWQRWVGTSYTHTQDGPVSEGEHGGLMVMPLQQGLKVDVRQTVNCETRPGDAW